PHHRCPHPVLLHSKTEIEPAPSGCTQPRTTQERAVATVERHQGQVLLHHQSRPPRTAEFAYFFFGVTDQPHGSTHPFGDPEFGARPRPVREKSLRSSRKPPGVVAFADRHDPVYAGALRPVGAA